LEFSRFAPLLLLLATSCDPATRVNDRGAATPAAQIDDSRRKELRACIRTCDRKHERESAAHVDCVRGCLGIDERTGNHEANAAAREGELSAPLAIAFAMGVSSALAILALLF
jgi:hypothetical protein